ncbi:MAG: polysaccharide biosynthesis C-terminal domain-containing protein [bacterium]
MQISLKKFGFLISLSLFIKFLTLFFGIYTNRWINKIDSTDLSQFNQIIALNTIILSIITFAIPLVIQKYYTENTEDTNERRSFWTTFFIFRLLSYFVGLILILISINFTSIANLWLAITIYSLQFILLIDSNYKPITDAVHKTWLYNTTDLITKFLVFLGLVSVGIIYGQSTLTQYLFILLFSYVVLIVLDAVLFRGETKFGIPQWKLFTSKFKSLSVLSITNIIATVYSGIDILIIGKLNFSASEINGYSNGLKFFGLVLVVPYVAISPLVTFIKNRLDNYQTYLLFGKIIKFNKKIAILEWCLILLIAGSIVSSIVYFIAPWLIQVIDPNLKYPLGAETLKILSLAYLVIFPTNLLSNLLVFFNKEKLELYGVIILMFVSVLLYLYLIPKYGAIGAAYSTLGYLVVDFIIKLISFFGLTKMPSNQKSFSKFSIE